MPTFSVDNFVKNPPDNSRKATPDVDFIALISKQAVKNTLKTMACKRLFVLTGPDRVLHPWRPACGRLHRQIPRQCSNTCFKNRGNQP